MPYHTSKRFYSLISNGLSACGFLLTDILRGAPCKDSGAEAAMKKQRCFWDLNRTSNIPAATTSLFFYSLLSIFVLISLLYLLSSKEKWALIYIHVLKTCLPSHRPLPGPLLLCGNRSALLQSSDSITNKQPTRLLTALAGFFFFFYGREKWIGLMFRHKWSSVLISLMKLD